MEKLPQILLVEDNRAVAETIAHALQNSYQVDIAGDGKSAIYKTDTSNYDLIILDLRLPDINGLDVCVQLRERGVTSAILVLSGEVSVISKINLLDAGANDYLTKPFSLGELKARMRSHIRSSKTAATHAPKSMTVGGLMLDRHKHTVSRDGQELSLRRKEFAILECLMENAGLVVTRGMLAGKVWQEHEGLWTNTVDVHIKYLRDKVDRPFDKPLIKTVHGLGYKLDVAGPSAKALKVPATASAM